MIRKPEYDYYLVNLDYNKRSELTVREKSKSALEICKKHFNKFVEKRRSNKLPSYAYDCSYIIFWRNLPKSNIPDNTEDTLFLTLCKNIRNFYLGSCIVQKLDVLANGSIETFIQRFCLMKKLLNREPRFLDNTTDSLFKPKAEDLETPQGLIQGFKRSTEEYNHLINFLENLYVSVKGQEIINENYGFIHYYFEWQKGNMLVKDVLAKLGNMSKRTFYLYVNEFEHHPYYPEYCKIYFMDLIEQEKKGPIDIDWQEYYNDVASLYEDNSFFTDITPQMVLDEHSKKFPPSEDFILKNCQKKEIDINSFDQINVEHICKKYNLTSPLDVYRLYLTAKKKLKIK